MCSREPVKKLYARVMWGEEGEADSWTEPYKSKSLQDMAAGGAAWLWGLDTG